jgi:Icc-related predicted phosphoesterase
MKIKLVSDLHLEFSDINIQNEHDYDLLILGGDIMIAQDLHDYPPKDSIMEFVGARQEKSKRFRDFLKRVSFQFPQVIYIAGNHEYYHGKYPDAIDYLKTECESYSNIHMLEMESLTIQDITFVAGTLWTDMNKQDPLTLMAVKDAMNDYHVVRNSQRQYAKLSPIDTVRRHMDTMSFIKTEVEKNPDGKYVVVGHHAPSLLSVKPKYEKDYQINGAYRSDLSEFILDHPQIKLWTHGHTHNAFDYMIGSTRVVCNPRGYEGYEEDSGWNPQIILEV